jgi:hypothetical protein
VLMHVGNAIRRRCGWHIVQQGCKNIPFQKFITGADKNDETKDVVSRIKVWIQESLMKEVETKESMKCKLVAGFLFIGLGAATPLTQHCFIPFIYTGSSKSLLLRYIQSDHVLGKIGSSNVDGIINFLRDHVFTHEERFVAYKYNYLRSFRDYSNTPLEGTNGGVGRGCCWQME